MVKIELDINTQCRACFSEEQEMHYLFGEFDQGLSLSEILNSISPFQIQENDGLSPYLCEICTTVVVDFFNFSTFYRENEKYIKSLLNREHKNLVCTSSESINIKESKSDDLNENSENVQVPKKDENCSVQKDNASCMELVIGEFIDPQNIKQEILPKNDIIDGEHSYVVSTNYACEECGKLFLLKSDLQQHKQINHRKSVSQHDNVAFKPTVEENINGRVEKFHCNICKKEFMTSSEIQEHYTVHKKYVCEHCGAGFLKKSYLDDHREIHTTEKRHICPICAKAFRRRTVLVKHKKIHTHPRHYICEICGLRFNDKGTLKTHIKLRHTKERNFQCTICGQQYSLKSTLLKHIFRHNEKRERPFTCSICFVAYRDKSSLNRHMMVKHSGNAKKPSCEFCNKQYTTNTNLLKHIRKHHTSQFLNTNQDLDSS